MGLGIVFVKVQRQQHQIRTQLPGNEPGHAAPAAVRARNIVACHEDAAADRERCFSQLGAVELLDGCIKGVAVDVDDVLA